MRLTVTKTQNNTTHYHWISFSLFSINRHWFAAWKTAWEVSPSTQNQAQISQMLIYRATTCWQNYPQEATAESYQKPHLFRWS